jgi:hypothetical protein
MPLSVEVVEPDAPAVVGVGAGRHHPRRCAVAQAGKEEVGEQERRQVVDCDRPLVPVLGQLAGLGDHSRVVDEHVDARTPLQQLVRQAPDLGLRRQVGAQGLGLLVAARLPQLLAQLRQSLRIAPHRRHAHPAPGQLQRRRRSDPRTGAGDDDGPLAHAGGSTPTAASASSGSR